MDHKQKFIHINRIEPRENLRDVVLLRINLEKRREAKIRLALTSATSLLSLIALVPVIQYFITEFSQSGFYQYLSILFSDGSSILLYWKELGLSLLESLPTLSITAVLVLVFILFATSKFIIQDSKVIFNKTQLA
jgi:hypothetical protein